MDEIKDKKTAKRGRKKVHNAFGDNSVLMCLEFLKMVRRDLYTKQFKKDCDKTERARLWWVFTVGYASRQKNYPFNLLAKSEQREVQDYFEKRITAEELLERISNRINLNPARAAQFRARRDVVRRILKSHDVEDSDHLLGPMSRIFILDKESGGVLQKLRKGKDGKEKKKITYGKINRFKSKRRASR